jgi:hypothetical protein
MRYTLCGPARQEATTYKDDLMLKEEHRISSRKKLLLAASSSASAAMVNLVSTIIVVRLLGNDAYVAYTVDLAVISLAQVLFEAIPSNFLVFKIQEEPVYAEVLAMHSIVSAVVVLALTMIMGFNTSVFQGYSLWMSVYASVLPLRRYADIRLQAIGKVHEFFNLEGARAVLRLVLLLAAYVAGCRAEIVLWLSIAVSFSLVQLAWAFRSPEEVKIFQRCMRIANMKLALHKTRDFRQYYVGIALKRIRDNALTIIADNVLPNKEQVAAFYLAIRGYLFSVGQIRLLESLMNHRASAREFASGSVRSVVMVALASQVLIAVTSQAIAFASGTSFVSVIPLLLLGLTAWAYIANIMFRSKALSSYNVTTTNVAMLTQIAVFALGGLLLAHSGVASISALCFVQLASECSATMVFAKCKSDPARR